MYAVMNRNINNMLTNNKNIKINNIMTKEEGSSLWQLKLSGIRSKII